MKSSSSTALPVATLTMTASSLSVSSPAASRNVVTGEQGQGQGQRYGSKDFIEVPVSLSADDGTRHWLYLRSTPRTEEEKDKSIHKTDFGGTTIPDVMTKIHNGRTAENRNDLTLDDASFELVDCPTALSTKDFYAIQDTSHPKSNELKQKYYEEVADFVKRTVKCDKVVVFNHQVRTTKDRVGVAGYAGSFPHTDSAPVSGDATALFFLNNDQEDADKEHKSGEADNETETQEEEFKRYAYLNLWRNINDDHPIQNNHLAMLDERTTVKPDDYIAKDVMMDEIDAVQYCLNARHASQHKWYYFPEMTKHEGLLFKQTDSDWTKSGRICFHMSVNDNEAAEQQQHPRESIEVRMMCYWKSPDSGVDSMPTKENANIDKIKKPSQLAMEMAGASSSLNSASFSQLLMAMFYKAIGKEITSSSYSGKPEDYVERFTTAMEYYPSWPKDDKRWVEKEMKKAAGDDVMKRVHFVANLMVDDFTGVSGTKYFSRVEKDKIVDHLMKNDKYLGFGRKHLAE